MQRKENNRRILFLTIAAYLAFGCHLLLAQSEISRWPEFHRDDLSKWAAKTGKSVRCGTQQFRRETASGLSVRLREALEPLLREIESLNERIQEYDRRIEKMANATYPEVQLLKQVKGVGDLIAATPRLR